MLFRSQVKKVPLQVTFSPEDAGTDVTATISPKEVEIIGDPATVKDIDSITLGAINVNTAENGDTYDFDISVPTGVSLNAGQPTTATVTVSINDAATKKFTITDISLDDIKKDDTAEVTLETESLEVTLSGSQKLLDSIDADDISEIGRASCRERV